MVSCLARDYDDPDNAGMVYQSAEGGYQGQVSAGERFRAVHAVRPSPRRRLHQALVADSVIPVRSSNF
jgi:hypothetical protein